MLPPAVGSPSVAYHCRSTTVSGTPALLHAKNVSPWLSERAVLKLARVRSAKKRCPPLSTASSVSPPPAHDGLTLPSVAVAAGIHLKVLPPSWVRQIQLVFDESEPGTLV